MSAWNRFFSFEISIFRPLDSTARGDCTTGPLLTDSSYYVPAYTVSYSKRRLSSYLRTFALQATEVYMPFIQCHLEACMFVSCKGRFPHKFMYNSHCFSHIKTFINTLGPVANYEPTVRSIWRLTGINRDPSDRPYRRIGICHCLGLFITGRRPIIRFITPW